MSDTPINETIEVVVVDGATNNGSEMIVNTDGSVPARSLHENFDGYEPDPSNASLGTYHAPKIDASQRVETHAAVSSDEGSDRDDFPGAALSADWVSTVGTGGSVAVANSLVTLTSGTTNGSITKIVRGGDYAPFTAVFYGTISQRIANQTIIFGLVDSYSTITVGAYVKFTGTTNTTCQFISQSSSAATDTQTSTVSIPSGNTSTAHSYKIDVSNNQATLSIDGVVVAIHTVHIPGAYDVLNQHIILHNTAGAGSSTTVTVDFVSFLNWNRIQVDTDFPGEPLNVNLPDGASVGARANRSKTYTFSTDVTLPTSGTETRAILITNSGTKIALLRKMLAAIVSTTAAQAAVRIYVSPTITSNGTAVTVSTSNIGSLSPASTLSVYSLPTISANGTKVFTLLAGGGTSPVNINHDFDLGLSLQPGSSILITGTPDGTNRVLATTLSWDEV